MKFESSSPHMTNSLQRFRPDRRASLHANQDGTVVEVIRINIVDRFLLTQTVFIVFKCNGIRAVACACKLLAAPTEGIAAVRQRITYAVVGDCLPVVFRQLIAPCRICVCVGSSFHYTFVL